MPRFANLKGSMNPFDNNKPVLSSSERLKNRRDKTIYQSQKQHFHSKKKCGNKNVKYYDNGTIRSTDSYKMNMKLSRGAVLCQDCEGNGTLCENIFDKKNLTKITMGNNTLSTLNLETGLIGTGGDGGHTVPKNVIINTDVTGVWGGSPIDISKSIIGPSGSLPFPSTIPMPYGYVHNLIKVPRNLNGSGVIIDPSNVLFPMYDNCNSRIIPKPNYMNFASIKTFIIYEGPISIGPSIFLSNWPTSTAANTIPGTTNYYANIIGQYVSYGLGAASSAWTVDGAAPTGQVKRICPTGRQILVTDTQYGPPPGFANRGSIFTVDIFKVYIEITYSGISPLWQGSIYPSSDKNNHRPQFKPNTIDRFRCQGWEPLIAGLNIKGFYIDSDWAANYTFPGPLPGLSNNGGSVEMNIAIDQNNVDNCDTSQIRGNDTKQSYMSCLEDGTKKINFTTNDDK